MPVSRRSSAKSRREPRPAMVTRPLWTCPRCGNRLVTRNMWHSCGNWPLSHHFRGKPELERLWRHFVKVVRRIGPVRVVSSKTRLVVMGRVRFGGVLVRKDHLRAHLWLTRRSASKRFVRIDRYAPDCFVHAFELRSARDLDAEMLRYLRQAYAVGQQQHLIARARRRGLSAR